MLSNKNKVIITVLAILSAIVLIVIFFNKTNMMKKVERYVDNESEIDDSEEYTNNDTEDGEEDGKDDEDDEDDAEEGFAEGDEDEDVGESKKTDDKKVKVPKSNKKESNKIKDVKNDKDAKDDIKPQTQSGVATKLKQFIDTLEKELKDKPVSQEIKNKVMKDLLSNVASLQEMGASVSTVITESINKYSPPKSTYVDAPIVTRSMDRVKGHIKAALDELDSMSGASKKETFSERFTPSRPAPPNKVTPLLVNEHENKDTIEGFENAPHYALY